MKNEIIPIPNQMSTEAKMNEFIEKQRELTKMQQLNNQNLLSQNLDIGEKIKETAIDDELALVSGVTLVSKDLKNIAVNDWYSIKKSIEINNDDEEERKLGR